MNRLLDPSLPEWVWDWVSSLAPEEVRSVASMGSSEANAVFRFELDRKNIFLKIGPDLQREYEKLRWLDGRQPCPRPLGYTTHDGTDALLMSAIEGEGLAGLSTSLPPQIIVERLATALLTLHATEVDEWPFGKKKEGDVLVHGDACLPNILYYGSHLSGYIDVGDMSVEEPEIDLAAAVWSLQYNLGPGYGQPFLQAYGWKSVEEEDVEILRRRYEQGYSCRETGMERRQWRSMDRDRGVEG